MSDTITITGNIATEPEHKRTPAGVAITTFRVASGQRRYDRNTGTWVDAHTNWYTVSAFRGLAEHAFRSLRKGDRVLLTGRLRLRAWDTGTKKGLTAEIDVEAIGHDLLFGTTRFEKDAASLPSNSSQAANDWSPEEERPSGDWVVPGADAPREPVLIGAGSAIDEAQALVDSGAPF
jgi:single-strand DNA-binding protein